jgi:hypothetical protein
VFSNWQKSLMLIWILWNRWISVSFSWIGNSFLRRTACEHMLHQMFYVDVWICMIYGTAQSTINILLFFLKFVVEISVYFDLYICSCRTCTHTHTHESPCLYQKKLLTLNTSLAWWISCWRDYYMLRRICVTTAQFMQERGRAWELEEMISSTLCSH